MILSLHSCCQRACSRHKYVQLMLLLLNNTILKPDSSSISNIKLCTTIIQVCPRYKCLQLMLKLTKITLDKFDNKIISLAHFCY
jgi:hypothetical protein